MRSSDERERTPISPWEASRPSSFAKPSCGAEVIPFRIEGIGRAGGEFGGVVFEPRQEKADAVSVGDVGCGGNAPGIIAGADGKRLKHALTHDVVKRHADGAFHDDACDACAEVAVMEGFARTGRKPVFRYAEQLAEGAARLHAA